MTRDLEKKIPLPSHMMPLNTEHFRRDHCLFDAMDGNSHFNQVVNLQRKGSSGGMGETLIYQNKPLNNKHTSNSGLILHIKHKDYEQVNAKDIYKAIFYASQNWLLLQSYITYIFTMNHKQIVSLLMNPKEGF